MIALSEHLIRSVKLTSPASAAPELGSDAEEEEDGTIQPEQNRSHLLIESMLSSSPPQPSFIAHAQPASSSSSSPAQRSGSRSPASEHPHHQLLQQTVASASTASSPSSPRSPQSATANATVSPVMDGRQSSGQQPRPQQQQEATAAHRPLSPAPAALAAAASQPASAISPAASPPLSSSGQTAPAAAAAATAIAASRPPPLRISAEPTSPGRRHAATAAAAVAGRAAAAPAATAAAVAALSPVSPAARVLVSQTSTLSADMFSKAEVQSPPLAATQSSLTKELTGSGLFRVTRPYSASANSSPAHHNRSVRDGEQPSEAAAAASALGSASSFFSATSDAAVPPRAGGGAAGGSGSQPSSASTSPVLPPAHRRTRSRGRTASSSVSVLQVFPAVDRPPMQLLVPIHCPVHRVIEMVIAQHRDDARQPPLRWETADAYELRVLDDDDGTPDEDMPPLDRFREIQEYGVDAVAFVEAADYQQQQAQQQQQQQRAQSPSAAASASPGGGQLKASNAQQAAERQVAVVSGFPPRPPPVVPPGSLSGFGSFSLMSGSRWDNEVVSPRSAVGLSSQSRDGAHSASGFTSPLSPLSSLAQTPSAASHARQQQAAHQQQQQAALYSGSRLKVLNGRIGLKVVFADMETHVLSVAAESRLEDLLPLLSRKKSSQMQPEHWKFLYPAQDAQDAAQPPASVSASQRPQQQAELDMKTPIHALHMDELRLLNRLETPRRALPSASSLSSSSSGLLPHPDQFVFTVETASAYSEYRVVKTNQRGKRQHRMFGIDRHKVYNKHVAAAGHRRRISFEVSRAYRTIRSIASISISSAGAAAAGADAASNRFTIVYHEKGGKLTSREYETETRMECAEIVAKVRFLMSLAHSAGDANGAAAGSAGAGAAAGAAAGGGGGSGASLASPSSSSASHSVHSSISGLSSLHHPHAHHHLGGGIVLSPNNSGNA